MYDSVNYLAIPQDAALVAGYVDGANSKWPDEAWGYFPNAELVRICTWGPRHLGNCLDVEQFDSVPTDIPDWLYHYPDGAFNRGITRPIIYCAASAWDDCIAQVPTGAPVQWWVAHYTNTPHLCGPQCNPNVSITADATQWASNPKVTGGFYDLSIVSPTFAPV